MPSSQLVVGAVVVDSLARPTRVLAARRTSGAAEARGRWEFPGGKVEPGESPVEALRRELREELAIDLTVGGELGEGDGWTISERLVLRLFVAQVAAGEPTPGPDHDGVRWLGLDELDAVEWLDSDRGALALVRQLLVA